MNNDYDTVTVLLQNRAVNRDIPTKDNKLAADLATLDKVKLLFGQQRNRQRNEK